MGRPKGSRSKAPDVPTPKLEYLEAPELEKMARSLINDNHSHLVNARMRYVFRSTAAKSKGVPVLGTTKLVSGLNAYLANLGDVMGEDAPNQPLFLLVVAKDEFDKLEAKGQKRLVDHLLTYCWVTEGGQMTLRRPDVEEFTEILGRYGIPRTGNLKEFAEIAAQKVQQMTLDNEFDDGDDMQKRAAAAGITVH